MKKHFALAGFTLIELSISLVIIGILVAAVVAGQDLLKSARIEHIATDMQKYDTAVKKFREKYLALPGDMPDAATYAAAMVGGATLGNGNGDGAIEPDPTVLVAGGYSESYLVWQHLSFLGFLESPAASNATCPAGGASCTAFTGMNSNGPGSIPSVGKDIPAGSIKNSAYRIYTDNLLTISLGTTSQASSHPEIFQDGILTPAQAFILDKKIDDGFPTTGRVAASDGFQAGATDCAYAPGPTLIYDVANKDTSCVVLYFIKD